MIDNPLWQYSLQLYRQQGVEIVLLQLQDQFSADINVLLASSFLAAQGQRLTEPLFKAWQASCSDWQQHSVQPLRALRRHLKKQPDVAAFREKLKHLELEAEQIEQQRLWQDIEQLAEQEKEKPFELLVRANLSYYLQTLPGCEQAKRELLEVLTGLIITPPSKV